MSLFSNLGGNPDDNAINGTGSASDYDFLTAGTYSASQDPATAYDNGTMNNANTGTGTASSSQTVTPPAGGSSYTPPSWLTGLLAASSGVAQTVNTVQGVINGKGAVSPAAAGQPLPAPGKATVSFTSSQFMKFLPWIVAGLGIIAAFFFLKKKK